MRNKSPSKEIIYGKLLALLREIKLKEPDKIESFRAGFLCLNDKNNFNTYGNIGLEWWYTEKAFKILDQISKMITFSDSRFIDEPYQNILETIKKVIQSNTLNINLFKQEMVFKATSETLLDASAHNDYNDLAKILFDMIEEKLLSSISEWMILYPMTQLSMDTFHFENFNFTVLNSVDDESWRKLTSDYKSSSGFNPSTGKDFVTDVIPAKYNVPQNWMVFKLDGTKENAVRKMEMLIRKIIVCIYSFFIDKKRDVHSLTENTSPCFYIQFPKEEKIFGHTLRVGALQYLQPAFSSPVKIELDILKQIDSYYKSILLMDNSFQKRFHVATQFIHYGMMSYSHIERYMHFYIALDALFGERQNVEASINRGIIKTNFEEPRIQEKSAKLYDLRNEILHGGCSNVADWKDYDKYFEEYDVVPFVDIEMICYRSIKNYFKFVSEESYNS